MITNERAKRQSTVINIRLETLRDHGVDATAAGARRFARQCLPPRAITSAGQYVAAVRGCARTCHVRVVGEGRVDGRLVAAGWNHVSPTKWLNGGLEEFLAYWKQCAERPNVVGSDHNPWPEAAFAAMRQGIPARAYLALYDVPGVLGRGSHRATWSRLLRLRRAARAARRTSMRNKHRWSLRALSLLGRLCPELQRVAVDATERRVLNGVIRASDIDWPAVARVQRQMLADSTGRVRVAWATGRRQGALAPQCGGDFASWLAPAYPRCSVAQAAQLARGVSPAELSGGLTRREAHTWLTEHPDWTAARWLLEAAAVPPYGTQNITDISVARWLVDVRHRGDWNALAKTRTARFGGNTYEFQLLSQLDEVRAEHLANGPRTSVELVFRRAAEDRAGMAAYRECDEVCSRLPESWPALPDEVRLLSTPAQIVARGDAHHHCVGMYVPQVRRGECWILSVEVDGEESTAQIDSRRRVIQHFGPGNSAAAPGCCNTLQLWLDTADRRAA